LSCAPSSGEPLITPETIAHVAAVVREKGTDAWWLAETADLLPEALRDRAEDYRRGDDTMVSVSTYVHMVAAPTFTGAVWSLDLMLDQIPVVSCLVGAPGTCLLRVRLCYRALTHDSMERPQALAGLLMSLM